MADYPVFDVDAAFERVDNDKELFFELIGMFFDEYDKHVSDISTAVESKNYDDLEKTAHALKSALGNLGAMKSYGIAFELEQAGRDERGESLPEQLASLVSEIDLFRKEIEQYRT